MGKLIWEVRKLRQVRKLFCEVHKLFWQVEKLFWQVQNGVAGPKSSEGKTSPTNAPVQKRYQHGVPNYLKWFRGKNVTNMGSRMTSGMFGPKTLPTRGPERPFRCLDGQSAPIGILTFKYLIKFSSP